MKIFEIVDSEPIPYEVTAQPGFVPRPGIVRFSPGHVYIERCELIPLKLMDENMDQQTIYPNRVKHYYEKGWDRLPLVFRKADGRYFIDDGNHRYHAARKKRMRAMLCWVRDRTSMGGADPHWIDEYKPVKRPRTIIF